MSDEILSRSRLSFSNLTSGENSRTVMAGRYPQDAEKEPYIWMDIVTKLGFSSPAPGSRILDIGCGVGPLTDRMIELAQKFSLRLDLLDFPEVISNLSRVSSFASSVNLVSGIFPSDMPDGYLDRERFEFILMYSVIHYSSRPLELIRAAVELLAPGGVLLVGDIPNLSKKGRFLASKNGRAFEAHYKQIPLEQVPHYKTHHDFVASAISNQGVSPITDELVAQILTDYRGAGYEVCILPQNDSLPFCFTREDIIIRRFD